MTLIIDGHLSWQLHGKISVSATIGDVGIFLSPCALKSLNSREKFLLRIMYATFNGNSCTTIISYYSSTNASAKKDIIIFYNKLCSLVQQITKHYTQIINVDMNVQIGKDRNKFCLYNSSNRNGEYIPDFSLQNKLACLNTKF